MAIPGVGPVGSRRRDSAGCRFDAFVGDSAEDVGAAIPKRA